MKTFMFTLALSVLLVGNSAKAQDGKTTFRTKSQMTEQLLASLPTQDIYTSPKLVFSVSDQHLISMLPLSDEQVEVPNSVQKNTAVANTTVTTPTTTPKVEVKATTDTRRVGDK